MLSEKKLHTMICRTRRVLQMEPIEIRIVYSTFTGFGPGSLPDMELRIDPHPLDWDFEKGGPRPPPTGEEAVVIVRPTASYAHVTHELCHLKNNQRGLPWRREYDPKEELGQLLLCEVLAWSMQKEFFPEDFFHASRIHPIRSDSIIDLVCLPSVNPNVEKDLKANHFFKLIYDSHRGLDWSISLIRNELPSPKLDPFKHEELEKIEDLMTSTQEILSEVEIYD